MTRITQARSDELQDRIVAALGQQRAIATSSLKYHVAKKATKDSWLHDVSDAQIRAACKKLVKAGTIENSSRSDGRAEWSMITPAQRLERAEDLAKRDRTKTILEAAGIETKDMYIRRHGAVLLSAEQLDMLITAAEACKKILPPPPPRG